MLKAELAAAYNALHAGRSGPDLAPLAVQYADFAAWQCARLDGGALEAQARYGAPVLSAGVLVLSCASVQGRCDVLS